MRNAEGKRRSQHVSSLTRRPHRLMAYELLTFQVDDRIATITVNRPDKLNALNDALIAELGFAIDEAVKRADVGAVLLTGAGRGLVAGGHIRRPPPHDPRGPPLRRGCRHRRARRPERGRGKGARRARPARVPEVRSLAEAHARRG